MVSLHGGISCLEAKQLFSVFALATLTMKPSLRPRVRHTLSLGLVESADNKRVFLLASASAQSSKVKDILTTKEEIPHEAKMVEIAWLCECMLLIIFLDSLS
jgi:uncharacterized protein YwbE